MIRRVLKTAALFTGLLLQITAAQAGERWYSEKQVKRGAGLFTANCAQCHGAKAQGLTEDWRKPGPDGRYPAPPLNGTAHAWHHPLPQLRRTVRDGGIRLGGTMPAFGERLTAPEIDAAIAWLQSHWSDEVYTAWQGRGGVGGKAAPRPLQAKSNDRLIATP
jgi:mono/diheme cytochrome c family protein